LPTPGKDSREPRRDLKIGSSLSCRGEFYLVDDEYLSMFILLDWSAWTIWRRNSDTSVISTRNGHTAKRTCYRLRTSRSAVWMSSK
jgi:hypothetical protein